MLNFTERYRQYVTMKVLGFSKAKIRSLIIKDCLFTTIPGILLGIPAGFAFLKFYISAVSFENCEWLVKLNILHFIIIVIAVLLCSIMIHIWISYKAHYRKYLRYKLTISLYHTILVEYFSHTFAQFLLRFQTAHCCLFLIL